MEMPRPPRREVNPEPIKPAGHPRAPLRKRQGKPLPTARKRKNNEKYRKIVLSRDNYTCQMCGNPYPESELENDHIVPLALGGPDQTSNMQCLCIPCHREKSEQERKDRDNPNE